MKLVETGGKMATAHDPHARILRDLASLILAVAGESVSMVKRHAPEHSLRLKPKDEWGIYLEFLKILFNFSDRLSALYLPLKEQPQFMDSLEDAVSDQLKAAMAPALSQDADPMEIVITVGQAVSNSRELYERFRFDLLEENTEKAACLDLLGERVAEAVGTKNEGMVPSAAILCASAVIPAMNSLFESLTGIGQNVRTPAGEKDTPPQAQAKSPQSQAGKEIKLVSVMASIQGEEVETRWGFHPQFTQDLTPEESRKLTRLMNRITRILGERYAAVAFSENWAAWHHPGHA